MSVWEPGNVWMQKRVPFTLPSSPSAQHGPGSGSGVPEADFVRQHPRLRPSPRPRRRLRWDRERVI